MSAPREPVWERRQLPTVVGLFGFYAMVIVMLALVRPFVVAAAVTNLVFWAIIVAMALSKLRNRWRSFAAPAGWSFAAADPEVPAPWPAAPPAKHVLTSTDPAARRSVQIATFGTKAAFVVGLRGPVRDVGAPDAVVQPVGRPSTDVATQAPDLPWHTRDDVLYVFSGGLTPEDVGREIDQALPAVLRLADALEFEAAAGEVD